MAQANLNDAELLPLPVCLDGKAVYINKLGSVVLQTSFDYYSADVFSDGLARFKEDGKYGFINEAGKIVIKPTFDSVSWFSEGLAQVCMNDKRGFIDNTGEVVIQVVCDDCRDFANGLAFAAIENGSDQFDLPAYKVGFIDKTGKIAVGKTKDERTGKFDDAGDFSEVLASVKIGDKWGFVNEKDEIVIRFRFKKAKSFADGLAPVSVNGRKWGFIDKSGKFAIEPQFTDADGFSEGLAAISTHKSGLVYTGFIDESGSIVFNTPNAMFIRKFEKGIASFISVGKSKGSSIGNLINKAGEIIFQEDDAIIWTLKNGVAAVIKGHQTSYIDTDGKYIWNAVERNKGLSPCLEPPPYVKKKPL